MAATTGAFAQSTVTLYGVFDTGFQSNKLTAGDTTVKQTAGVQGGMSGNRIGFKGTEDLGGGLKANFVVELGLDPTEANSAFGDNNRQSYVGVEGAFGTFNMGRQYSLHHNNQAAGDMLGNLNGQTGYLGALDSLVRVSNSFIYTSPSFSGFTVAAEMALGETWKNADAAEGTNNPTTVAASNEKKNETTGVRLNYANGPLAVGYAYEQTKNGTFAAIKLLGVTASDIPVSGLDYNKRKANNLSASYDFGVAKVGFVNNSTKYDTVKWTSNTLSAAVPMGAATLFGSTSAGKIKEDGESVKVSAYQLGASYALSKRTNVYAFTGQQKFKDVEIKYTSTTLGLRHTF
ncbi:porin [Limnohabitans sp. Hippo3]|uniref:porin n=1 Tax=Limnohabitans sp. Hippo3 TaxID=1597956 RepID=UPI0013048496|nr:porin [Limnohabitans sp. Hippo3]